MPAPPLTHHEIFRLAEPFLRRGRQVDLAASDRAARLLVFKPVEVAVASPQPVAGVHETLRLDCHEEARFRLTRTLTEPVGGLAATLQAEGPQPAELLARVDAVEPRQQLQWGPGFCIAKSYAAAETTDDTRAGGAPGRPATAVPLTLRCGAARVGAWTLTLDVKPKRGAAADIVIAAAAGGSGDLPEDLLAVLGWDWARLVRKPAGWISKLRLRGSPGRRTRTAEQALERAARHLAQVFGEAPFHFHRRHRLARWGVVFRRAIPSLTAIGLIVGALLLPRVGDGAHVGLWLALQYVPIALLGLSFTLQELPQFEIPPWPRRSRAQRWSEDAADGAQAPPAAPPPAAAVARPLGGVAGPGGSAAPADRSSHGNGNERQQRAGRVG